MFRDAAVLDRQRTAASFDKALERYAEQGERWFDGTAGSVDARLAVCERLLHSVRATVARLSSLTDARRYLEAAGDLETDRRALTALRDDLLTGASSREDVIGPPGWRTAIGPSSLPEAGYEMRMPYPPANMNESLKPAYNQAIEDEEDPFAPKKLGVHEPRWDPEVGDWAVPTLEEDMVGKTGEGFEPRRPLGGMDRRWVDLESARFVAANTDALDDNHELATRAHEYAAMKTSTFTPARSAAICERFVARVATLGRRAYRPAVVRTAAYQDFDDQAIYLC